MAKINKVELDAISTRKQNGNHPDLAPKEYGATLQSLQGKARTLGAFNLEGMVGKFDPEKVTMKQRSQMRRDPMVALGLHFRKTILVNAPWRIECEDPQIAAFVEGALRAIYPRLIRQMLMALDWGYIPIVKRFQREVPTWTYEDPDTKEMRPVWDSPDTPAVTWNAFQALPPEGATVTFSKDERAFVGFKHVLLKQMISEEHTPDVPASHALWVTHELDENFGDWYGYPLTGYAFRYWWSYWYQWLLADRHMEQDADPPLRVDYPPGSGPDPDNPDEEVDNYVIALKAGRDLRDGATVAVPSDYYEVDATGALARGARKWDMEFIKGGENIKAFHDSFQYLDVMKLRSIMVPDQALIGAKGSLSGNVAETYGQAFTESQALLMQWLIQHINEYMLPDLVAQNFVDAPVATMRSDGFRDQDMMLANQLLQTIAASDPASLQLDIRKLVKARNLPTLTIEEVQAAKEEAANAAIESAKAMAEAKGLGGGSDNKDQDNPQRTKIADARDKGK